MAEHFAIDLVVRAADFGVAQVYDDSRGAWVSVGPDERLFCCFRGLAMGWSWSLCVRNSSLTSGMVDAIVSYNPSLTSDCAHEQIVRERAPAPRLKVDKPLLCPYVDNGNSLCWDVDGSESFYSHVVSCLQKRGFVFKDLVSCGRVFDMAGVVWETTPRRWWPKRKRHWALRWALLESAGRPRITGHVAQILAGRMVNYCLLSHISLAVSQEIFAFARQHGPGWGVRSGLSFGLC